jgi:class 3 adenylate cyclase/CHASE2 domain-containing sensor protein
VILLKESTFKKYKLSPFSTLPRSYTVRLLDKLRSSGVKLVTIDAIIGGKSDDRKADLALAKAIKSTPTILLKLESSAGSIDNDRQTLQEVRAAAIDEGVGTVIIDGNSQMVREIPHPLTSRHLLSLAEAGTKYLGFNIKAPINQSNSIWYLNYYDIIDYDKGVPTYTYEDVLEMDDDLAREIFKDKVVFIGNGLDLAPMSPGGGNNLARDRFQTPHGGLFGVQIHALSFENLINKNWIERRIISIEFLWGGIILIIATYIFIHHPGTTSFITAFVLTALSLIISFLSFQHYNIFIGPFTFIGLLLATYGINLRYYFSQSQITEQLIKSTFSRYVDPRLVNVLISKGEVPVVGHKVEDITIMFTDLEGFSEISNDYHLSGLLDFGNDLGMFVNQYYESIGGKVLSKEGTILLFPGDALIAIWGHPLPVEDMTNKTFTVACQIAEISAIGNRKIVTRIGLEKGLTLVGNFGTPDRFEYTAIGGRMNRASRLEGLNKHFGSQIIVSDDFYQALNTNNQQKLIYLGNLLPKGQSEPLNVYGKTFKKPDTGEVKLWMEGIHAYQNNNLTDANAIFQNIINLDGQLKQGAILYNNRINNQYINKIEDTLSLKGIISFTDK